MAKPELNEVIEWLGRQDRNRFEIYDVDTQKTLEKCASYDDLSKGGFSPENYFENLADSGVRTIQIVKKKKNGSTYIREGCGLNFAISTEGNVAASGVPDRPAATTQQQPKSSAPSGFGLGNPGLSFPEIMEMRSQSDRFRETKNDLMELRSENKRLIEENRKLEKENLRHQLGIENKPSAVDKLVEGIASNPAALSQIIQSFKGGGNGNNPGLNAPQAAPPKLSDIKQTVVDFMQNDQVSDEIATAAYHVIVERLKGNEKFWNELIELFTKHQIIENASNDNNNSSDKI